MIEPRDRRDRQGRAYKVWRVRWRDDSGRERSRTLPRGTTKRQAEDFERRVLTLKRTGQLPDLDRGRETLEDFVAEWWELYAGPNLARSTLQVYAHVWNAHALPRLGDHRLRDLTPEVIARFRVELELAGVGAPTVRKTMSMLQGVLARAVEWGRVDTNAVKAVRKPAPKATREPIVLAPAREPTHPGIELSFDSKHGRLVYATDAYERWEHNVRAIALGLEALRAVDRYGITRRGEQYAGWKQLPAGDGPSAARGKRLIDELGGERSALMATHPDHGGDPRDFADVQAARGAA